MTGGPQLGPAAAFDPPNTHPNTGTAGPDHRQMAAGSCCLDGHPGVADEGVWAPTTPISTSLAAVFNNATRAANASSSSLGSTCSSCGGGVVGSPLSVRVAGGGAAAGAAADGGGGWVRGLILGLLGAELAYIILDRLGQLLNAHRGKVCMG